MSGIYPGNLHGNGTRTNKTRYHNARLRVQDAQKSDDDRDITKTEVPPTGSSFLILLVVMAVITWGVAATAYFGIIDYKSLLNRSSKLTSADAAEFASTLYPFQYNSFRHPLRAIGTTLSTIDDVISRMFTYERVRYQIIDKRRIVTKSLNPVKALFDVGKQEASVPENPQEKKPEVEVGSTEAEQTVKKPEKTNSKEIKEPKTKDIISIVDKTTQQSEVVDEILIEKRRVSTKLYHDITIDFPTTPSINDVRQVISNSLPHLSHSTAGEAGLCFKRCVVRCPTTHKILFKVSTQMQNRQTLRFFSGSRKRDERSSNFHSFHRLTQSSPMNKYQMTNVCQRYFPKIFGPVQKGKFASNEDGTQGPVKTFKYSLRRKDEIGSFVKNENLSSLRRANFSKQSLQCNRESAPWPASRQSRLAPFGTAVVARISMILRDEIVPSTNGGKTKSHNPPELLNRKSESLSFSTSFKRKLRQRLTHVFEQIFDVFSPTMIIFEVILPEKFYDFVDKFQKILTDICDKIVNTTLKDIYRCITSIISEAKNDWVEFWKYLKDRPDVSNFLNKLSKLQTKVAAKFDKLSDVIAINFWNLEQNQRVLTSIVITLAFIGLYHIFGTFFHTIFM